MIAWTWREYIDDPEHNPEWLARLPMVKGAFQTMRAAQEFLAQENIAQIEGWTVSGGSKRGWTTWMVGATECESCAAKIVAIAPVVPIVPDIHKDVHRMWQSYNAFTFAFQPYIDADLMGLMDDPTMLSIFDIVDPINFIDRLEKIPKFFFVSSDDEFMSMDWTNMGYYDKMKGEKHLLIKSNAEHSMATGLYTVMGIYGTMVRSLAAGITKRPSIKYEYNVENGDLSVIIPTDQVQPTAVKLKHAETISTERRDFRWMVQSNGY